MIFSNDAHALFDSLHLPTERYDEGEFIIVDPHGQIVLHYNAALPAKGLLSDLKKLLHASQIG